MLDLIRYQTQRTVFPTLDLDQLQDHFLDQDLEISINPLSVTIVTAWVIHQTIVFYIRIRNISRRQPNQERRNNYRNFKRYTNNTNSRSDSRYRIPNVLQHRVNFSEPPMYSDLQIRNQR